MRLAGTAIFAAAALLVSPAQADCLSDIKTILASSLTSGPYATELTSEAGGMTITAEVLPPNALHSKTIMADTTMEVTVLDGRAWMDMGQGWREMPATTAASFLEGFQGAAAMLEGVTAEQCLGTQIVEGRDLLVFKYDITISSIPSKATMYVDPATRLPVVVESLSDVAGTSTDTRATYRYDPTLTTTAPAP